MKFITLFFVFVFSFGGLLSHAGEQQEIMTCDLGTYSNEHIEGKYKGLYLLLWIEEDSPLTDSKKAFVGIYPQYYSTKSPVEIFENCTYSPENANNVSRLGFTRFNVKCEGENSLAITSTTWRYSNFYVDQEDNLNERCNQDFRYREVNPSSCVQRAAIGDSIGRHNNIFYNTTQKIIINGTNLPRISCHVVQH